MKNRKFLLVLPLLVIPFVVILFFVFGGGSGSGPSGGSVRAGGLNVKLPDAHFKKGKEKSKLSLYEEAAKDSVMQRHDTGQMKFYSSHPGDMDENESRVTERLAQLKTLINQKEEAGAPTNKPGISVHSDTKTGDLSRLMADLNNSKAHDPRIDQISSMLDKVMAIQHPEILRDSLSRIAKERAVPVYDVKLNSGESQPETFGSERLQEDPAPFVINRFYDLADVVTIENEKDHAIEAIIPETQGMVSGATIKLSLLNDVRINGQLIGKGQFVYGVVSLASERLKIRFSSIRCGDRILPVSMEAYDMDGLAGIYIPGSMNREVIKESGDQAMGTLGLTTLDPSIGAQAASAGIQAAKTLLGRKIKLVRVTVPAGYKVLLKDSGNK